MCAVEDTKTFFGILLLLLSIIGFHLSGHGYSVEVKDQCPSHWVMIAMAQPLHLIYLTTILGVPLYEVVRKCCHNYNPSMLIMFIMFIIKDGIRIVLLSHQRSCHHNQTMNGNESCEHFDNNTIDSCYFYPVRLCAGEG